MNIVILITPTLKEGHYDSWHKLIHEILKKKGFKTIQLSPTEAAQNESFLFRLKSLVKKLLHDYAFINAVLKQIYGNVFPRKILKFGYNINSIGQNADFIFFLNLDFLDNDPDHWNQWIRSNSTPWAGISLYDINTPEFYKRLYLNDPNLKAIFSLKIDLFSENTASSRLPPIINLPEITLSSIATDEESRKLKNSILKLSNGRPIITLCGSIESRKNIKLFLDASQHPKGSSYFFLLAGKISNKSITQDDMRLIKSLTKNESNVLVLNKFFESEATLNLLINLSSYIFAAYVDFDQSSNMLAKSGALKRPIIVTKNSYMAKVIKKYGIGYEIENSIESLFTAIDVNTDNPIRENAYNYFLSENNIDKFAEQLLKIFPK